MVAIQFQKKRGSAAAPPLPYRNYPEDLVKKYAASKLVVTSRIQAGLPCLGVGTPVIFIADEEVTSEKGSFNVPGRLGGLLDFFRIINYDKAKFTTDDEVLKGFNIINEKSVFQNKDNWKPYAEKLRLFRSGGAAPE